SLRETLSHAAATRGIAALLGPQIIPYRTWLAQLSGQQPRQRVLRELQLYDLLRSFPQYFDHSDLWQVCDSMLPLLEELDTQQVDPAAFAGLAQRDARLASQLGQEAQVITAVWKALRDDEPATSPLTLASQATQAFASLHSGDPSCSTVFVGCDEFSALECGLLKQAVQRGRALVCLQHHARHPNRSLAQLLEQLPVSHHASITGYESGYAFLHHCLDDAPLSAAATVANRGGFRKRWAIVPCVDDETQVQFVADDIRSQHSADRPVTAVVSENRRLLRRLRAVLESHAVTVDDEAGWTLSTTAAATVMQRLLDSIDQDFHYLPFLDFLKSPYLHPPGLFASREQLETTVHDFERRVVRRAQVHSELHRFRWYIEAQAAQVDASRRAELTRQLELLYTIEEATQALSQFQTQSAPRRVSEFLASLRHALERLGCSARLREDPAGEQILALLLQLEQDAGAGVRLTWRDARTWLARSLEQQRYQPERRGSNVRLLSLREAVLERFDVVYLLGANQEHFPSRDSNVSAFFNDGVRRELGIRTHSDTLALTRYRFKLLLSNAATVIACFARESQGEPLQATQWLTALDGIHERVYGANLHTAEISINETLHGTVKPELPPTWAEISARPAIPVNPRLIPETLSASAHQRLVDCPYLFYAQDCLRLRAADEIAEKLRKSEYGNRVHASLQEFHREPDTADLLRSDPESAKRRLFDISARIFERDIRSNFEHRVWLHRWQRSIPPYIDWQAQRALQYPLTDTEVTLSRQLQDNLSIQGKIDRIDRDQHGAAALVDYKTGQAGTTAAVRSGEDVQIVSYALLMDGVER
ncbi:MAG: PD-(D/E)XK nuclease family protein, partial [Gammaproteobacteria bacterium]|nr:PD-(D/E)XK nuclease family protein [Gammaproteobacteria bacterium]